MKKFRFLKLAFISLLLIVLFRGPIFRMLIRYHVVGERQGIAIQNQELIQEIQASMGKQPLGLMDLVKISRQITDRRLSFTTGHSTNETNGVYQTRKANCIGYAALFSSVFNYMAEKQVGEKQSMASHWIGKLELLGYDLHQAFGNHPFFRDHDFVAIKDLSTGRTFYVDPTVNDYLGIRFVKTRQE